MLFEVTHARRLRRRLGHIEQQVLAQFVGSGLVKTIGALLEQTFEFLINLTQQGANRGAIGHAAVGQTFDHARGDLP